MYCPNCGAMLEENSSSCPFCRTPMINNQNENINTENKEDNVTVTMYLVASLKDQIQTYTIPRGTKMDSQSIVDIVNQKLGSDLLSSDAKSFYVKAGGLTIEFAWYYKGTNERFDWNVPITKNIELEMKMYDGQIGNSIFQSISKLFH